MTRWYVGMLLCGLCVSGCNEDPGSPSSPGDAGDSEGRDTRARDADDLRDAAPDDDELRDAMPDDDDTSSSDTTDTNGEETSDDVSGDVSDTFACGSKQCDTGQTYCVETIPGVRTTGDTQGGPQTTYECKPYDEDECGPNPNCSCLKDKEDPNQSGGVAVTCETKGPGQFQVTLGYP